MEISCGSQGIFPRWGGDTWCHRYLSVDICWMLTSHVLCLTLVRHAKSTFVRYLSRWLTSDPFQRQVWLLQRSNRSLRNAPPTGSPYNLQLLQCWHLNPNHVGNSKWWTLLLQHIIGRSSICRGERFKWPTSLIKKNHGWGLLCQTNRPPILSRSKSWSD